MLFKIEYQFLRGRTASVLARRLQPGDFAVGPGSSLGDVPLCPVLAQPRAVLPDGTPDPDLFAFYLRHASDVVRLPVGAVVALAENATVPGSSA